jgi:hypothetical protein
MKNKIITFSFYHDDNNLRCLFAGIKTLRYKPADSINKGCHKQRNARIKDMRLPMTRDIFYEVVDREGVHYGKCMAIVLKSKIDSFVTSKTRLRHFPRCQLTVLVQTMLVTHKAEFPLYPGQTYVYKVLCYVCSDTR